MPLYAGTKTLPVLTATPLSLMVTEPPFTVACHAKSVLNCCRLYNNSTNGRSNVTELWCQGFHTDVMINKLRCCIIGRHWLCYVKSQCNKTLVSGFPHWCYDKIRCCIIGRHWLCYVKSQCNRTLVSGFPHWCYDKLRCCIIGRHWLCYVKSQCNRTLLSGFPHWCYDKLRCCIIGRHWLCYVK